MKFWFGVVIISIASSICGITYFDISTGSFDIGNTIFLAFIVAGWIYHCEKGRT